MRVHHDRWLDLYSGDARTNLADLPERSVHAVITSPPYFGLRDYGTPPVGWADGWHGELGAEREPERYVAHLMEVLEGVHRVLRDDGTLWLNLGDSFATYGGGRTYGSSDGGTGRAEAPGPARQPPPGFKAGDLIGIPWMVAFAARAAGWYLRRDVIWHKQNAMPESVDSRPTSAHEYLFMLTKSDRYYYDWWAGLEPLAYPAATGAPLGGVKLNGGATYSGNPYDASQMAGRRQRSVWTINTRAYPEAHYAVFPDRLVETPLLLSTSERGVCPECGLPAERLYSKVLGGERSARQFVAWAPPFCGHLDEVPTRPVRVTVGWKEDVPIEATVDALFDSTVLEPAVVLDPFGGSGTVGMVAQRHSRRAILIDLNGAYLAQQLRRNVNVPLGL